MIYLSDGAMFHSRSGFINRLKFWKNNRLKNHFGPFFPSAKILRSGKCSAQNFAGIDAEKGNLKSPNDLTAIIDGCRVNAVATVFHRKKSGREALACWEN